MKLKVTETYFDRLESKRVEKGTIIERGAERAKKLINAGVAEMVKETTAEPKEVSEEEKPKRRSGKTAAKKE